MTKTLNLILFVSLIRSICFIIGMFYSFVFISASWSCAALKIQFSQQYYHLISLAKKHYCLWFAIAINIKQCMLSLLLAVSFAAVPVLCWGEECRIYVQTGRWLAGNMDWRRREQRGWQGRRDVWRHMWERRRWLAKERVG